MMKPGEFVLTAGGIASEEEDVGTDGSSQPLRATPSMSIDGCGSDTCDDRKLGDESCDKIRKFTMIFNKYNSGLNPRPPGKAQEVKSGEGSGSKYTMIFNKDVTVRSKLDLTQPTPSTTDASKTDDAGAREATDPRLKGIESDLNSMKLNDAETLMNLYGISNLFIPELTLGGTATDDERSKKPWSDGKQRGNGPGLRTHSSLTSLSGRSGKGSTRRGENLKAKISSLTSLETHAGREGPRKHVSAMQERKLFRVRSLDLSESITSSDSEADRPHQTPGSEDSHSGSAGAGAPRKSDKKSRGDAVRKGDKDGGAKKQVQWKSEVDVIYFESHQAADGDRSGEVLGRVMEPLREEWEQQRTGFYSKMVALSFGSQLNESLQSLLKI